MTNCINKVSPFRFSDKNATVNERNMISSMLEESINLYGTKIEYCTYNYQLSSQDPVYGEHPTAPYSDPQFMIALAQLNNDSYLLSKWGIQTDADLTVIIPIRTFKQVWGDNGEPKSNDLIKLSELGWDGSTGAPLSATTNNNFCNRNPSTSAYTDYGPNYDATWYNSGPVYIVTERRWINIPQMINPLFGQYVYMLHCKRFEYSYQPNALTERHFDQVSDTINYGKQPGGTLTPTASTIYTPGLEDIAKDLFDYDNAGIDSSIYGSYGNQSK
jgi:hypothetical protein